MVTGKRIDGEETPNHDDDDDWNTEAETGKIVIVRKLKNQKFKGLGQCIISIQKCFHLKFSRSSK